MDNNDNELFSLRELASKHNFMDQDLDPNTNMLFILKDKGVREPIKYQTKHFTLDRHKLSSLQTLKQVFDLIKTKDIAFFNNGLTYSFNVNTKCFKIDPDNSYNREGYNNRLNNDFRKPSSGGNRKHKKSKKSGKSKKSKKSNKSKTHKKRKY
jgi:hypothetical protein